MRPITTTARREDPESSKDVVPNLTRGSDMEAAMKAIGEIRAAGYDIFTDTDLTNVLARQFDISPGRNVVAKHRQQLEDQGYVERYQNYTGKPIMVTPQMGKGRAVLGFYLTPKGRSWLDAQRQQHLGL